MSFLSPLFAVDLGTEKVRFYSADEERLCEVMTPKEPKRGYASPTLVSRGRITDERVGSAFFQDVLGNEFHQPLIIAKPRIVATVPCCFTQVEKIALARTLMLSGASATRLVASAVAAAFGAGVDLESNRATVLLSCGRGCSELAVVLSGNQVISEELSLTMDALTEAITVRLEKELRVKIEPQSIAKFLMLHSPFAEEKKETKFPAKRIASGRLEEISIPQTLISECSQEFISSEAKKIEMILRQLPATMATDIVEQGMILYGGLAEMKGLPLFLSGLLSLPVSCVPDPKECMIKGLKEMLSSISFPEYEEEILHIEVLGC